MSLSVYYLFFMNCCLHWNFLCLYRSYATSAGKSGCLDLFICWSSKKCAWYILCWQHLETSVWFVENWFFVFYLGVSELPLYHLGTSDFAGGGPRNQTRGTGSPPPFGCWGRGHQPGAVCYMASEQLMALSHHGSEACMLLGCPAVWNRGVQLSSFLWKRSKVALVSLLVPFTFFSWGNCCSALWRAVTHGGTVGKTPLQSGS